MTKRERNLLLLLLGVAGAGAWFYFTQSGRALVRSASETVSTGVEKLADLTNSTLNLIKKFESFSATPYPDARGWSIGYGHYMGPQPTMQTISESQAYDTLRDDAQTAADAVRASVAVPLNQNQFDALVSLAYNIGASAFKNSTLVRRLNAGDYDGAAAQFAVWRKSNGSINPTLVTRRAQEKGVFQS